MFQKAFSFAGTLLLTGAAILMTPGLSQAQHGGGHGGGGHGGGGGGHFSSGGGHGGAGFSHGGFNHGGFSHGGFNHGGFSHGGFNHGFHHGGGWWYPGYYGGYGYYPFYGRYGGYYPYYGLYGGYYPYSYDVLSPTDDSGYSGSYGDVSPDYTFGTNSAPPAAGVYQGFYPPSTATAEQDTAVHVTVTAPADAQLWFNGTPSTATGAVRQFESPPLAPGTRYTYELRARWNDNGHDVTQTQQVVVTAGAQVIVNFPVQPTKVPTALSH